MLRKSIIMMALAAAFTMNVSAVQIEVPAGQPPMPGVLMRVFRLMHMRTIGQVSLVIINLVILLRLRPNTKIS